MLSLLRGMGLLALMGVPLLVMLSVPRLFEVMAPPPTSGIAPALLATAVPPPQRGARIAPVTAETPPPTLAPPAPTATRAEAPPTQEPTGERAVIANTGGRGAALRAVPTGAQVASLRDGQVVLVLERQVVGGTEWAHVRTLEGADGWVIGVVAQRQPEPR